MLASLIRFFQSAAPWPAIAIGLFCEVSPIFSGRPATLANILIAYVSGALCGVGFLFVYSLVTRRVEGSVPPNDEER